MLPPENWESTITLSSRFTKEQFCIIFFACLPNVPRVRRVTGYNQKWKRSKIESTSCFHLPFNRNRIEFLSIVRKFRHFLPYRAALCIRGTRVLYRSETFRRCREQEKATREREREREREEQNEIKVATAIVTSLSQCCLRVSRGHIGVERSVKNERARAHKA